MRVLTLLSQKGGSGKTTLAGHLAIQAELAGSGPVGVLDADPQESLADWRSAREADSPNFSHTSLWRLSGDVERMRAAGMSLVVIDTPPGINSTIRRAVDIADLVVIPVKPSPHDLRALGKTVAVVESMGTPLVFVVNCASPWARITSDAAIALSQHGTLAPSIIHQRADFATSMIDGRTVMELSRRSSSSREVGELWQYLDDRLNARARTNLGPLKGVA